MYETKQGGHGMATTDKGRVFNYALQMVYLLQTLQ
jgi:hypothetical protein